MADKVNKEESVARVYQFLNKQKDWKTAADKNGDQTIIKTEFRAYLLDSGFKFNNGENKEDLIDAFWKSIDSTTSGKIGGGSALNNKNALDAKEIENVENSVQATQMVISFMQDKEAPAELDAQYRTAWKNSVKQGLIYKAAEYLKTGSLEDINDEWLANAYKLSSAKATADYSATATIKSELGNVEGYTVGDDKDLKNVIDNYVAQIEENPDKSDSDIIGEIKNLVSAYVDTAQTNSDESVKLLAEYGYDPYDSMNDLQRAVLTNSIKDEIVNKLNSESDLKELYQYNKEAIDISMASFIEDKLADASAVDFVSIKAAIGTYATEYITSTDFTQVKADFEALVAARADLTAYVITQFGTEKRNEERKAAVKEVFGSDVLEVVKKTIEGYKSVDEVTAAKTALEEKISNIEALLDESFLSALTDVTLKNGETKTIRLPDSTDKYSTNELTYKVENGNGNISIDSSGVVTIKGNNTGTFKNVTVSLYGPNENKLCSKSITIVVQPSTEELLSAVDNWNGLYAKQIGAVLPVGEDECEGKDRMTDMSFRDMYNKDAIVKLHISMDDSESWSSAGNNVDKGLDELGSLIKAALTASGSFDSSILETAINNVIQGYKNNKFADGCLNDDNDGGSATDLTNNLVWRMRNDRDGTGHRVVGTRDDDGSDSWVWGVRFKDVVDDILNEYSSLSAGLDSTVTHTTNDTSGEYDSDHVNLAGTIFSGGLANVIDGDFSIFNPLSWGW